MNTGQLYKSQPECPHKCPFKRNFTQPVRVFCFKRKYIEVALVRKNSETKQIGNFSMPFTQSCNFLS